MPTPTKIRQDANTGTAERLKCLEKQQAAAMGIMTMQVKNGNPKKNMLSDKSEDDPHGHSEDLQAANKHRGSSNPLQSGTG